MKDRLEERAGPKARGEAGSLREGPGPDRAARATVRGAVAFRPGDGMPIMIPRGAVEVEPAPDGAVLGWESEGSRGCAEISWDEYELRVARGEIVPERG